MATKKTTAAAEKAKQAESVEPAEHQAAPAESVEPAGHQAAPAESVEPAEHQAADELVTAEVTAKFRDKVTGSYLCPGLLVRVTRERFDEVCAVGPLLKELAEK